MGNEPRVCKGCGQSLEGLHGNVLVHAECRKEYDKWLRPQSKQKEHSKFKNNELAAFRNFHLKHMFICEDIISESLRLIIDEGYEEYGIDAIYSHLRWRYKKAGLKIGMPNNYKPHYVDVVIKKAPYLEDFFHTNKRKNS